MTEVNKYSNIFK